MTNNYSMQMPGGPGGVSISGKWLNKRTGKEIIVRDNIISDQGMQIICADGSMLSMNEFSRDYIQASEELYDSTGKVIGKSTATGQEIKNSANALNTPFDPKMSNVNYVENVSSAPTRVNDLSTVYVQQSNQNSPLIDKLFSKLNSTPTITVKIEWADFPKQELKTLIDYLDVDKKDIAEYVYTKFADSESVKLEIAQYLSSMLDKD